MGGFPRVWRDNPDTHVINGLRAEAERRFTLLQIPTLSADEWPAYAAGLRRSIERRLGARYDGSLPLDMKETGAARRRGLTIRKLFYQSRPGVFVTANLYAPAGRGPFPAVVNMHGHWSQGRLAARIQERGLLLAANGYVCLSVDAWGAGERSARHGRFVYHGGLAGAALFNVGETLMGAQVVDNRRAVDLLASLDFVDGTRIGATGASGGGNQCMWLAALDERVRASVPVASVGTFASYVGRVSCVCETLPGGLDITEEAGVLALAAPRALKLLNALRDSNPTFSPAEMLRSYRSARRVFQTLGADDALAYQVFDAPHGYWPEMQEAMLGWFDRHLKNSGAGAPRPFIRGATLPERELMVFPPGKRDRRVQGIEAYCVARGKELCAAFQARRRFEARRERAGLADALRAAPPPAPTLLRHGTEDGWLRATVATDCGKLLPFLVRPSRSRKRTAPWLLMGHPDGVGGIPEALCREAADAGRGVALLEASGTGQTAEAEPSPVCGLHEYGRGLLWLGRTLAGEWAREWACARRVLRRHFGAVGVERRGWREMAVAALFDAALYGGAGRLTLGEAPLSLRLDDARRPPGYHMALCIPGFLLWGDLPLAAALAKCPVEYEDARRFDGSPASALDVAAWRRETQRIRNAL